MHQSRVTSLIAALLLVSASLAGGQPPADPSGHWEGTFDVPGSPISFQLDIDRAGSGELAGAVSVSDATALPLAKVEAQGRSLTFYARSDQPFSGVVSNDGKVLSGHATLSGYSIPFAMNRTGSARLDPPVTSAPVSKDLEGTWNGTLDFNGATLHVILTLTNQSAGGSIGRIVSLDEGGLIVPVVITQKGSSVAYEQKGVAGSYAGTMNADGTELVGMFTQHSLSLPLVYRRAAK